MFKTITLFVCLLAACAPTASAQTDTWLEVRTPHFLIVTNSSEKEGRRVAQQFEGMRSVFQRVFPDAELDRAAPILVFAVQDKRTLQELEPEVYLEKGQVNLIGLFSPEPQKNYVLILINAPGARPYAPIYHLTWSSSFSERIARSFSTFRRKRMAGMPQRSSSWRMLFLKGGRSPGTRVKEWFFLKEPPEVD
jgi:hypothetical protein